MIVLLVLLFGTTVPGQNTTYRQRAAFDGAAGAQPVLVENFDNYINGFMVRELFSGVAPFRVPFPTVFWGGWGSGFFSGGGLIPEPRFTSAPLVMDFPSPVYGIGAYAFDDVDGSPTVSVIQLEVTTAMGVRFAVAEDVNSAGNVGFLGATSSQGIVRAVWSLAGTGGNLELDSMVLLREVDPLPPVVMITSPAANSHAAMVTVDVAGIVIDSSSVQLTSSPAGLNASAPAGGGNWSGTVPLLQEGPNVITITALDQFGNQGGSSVTVIRDTIAPIAEFVSPADGAVVGSETVTVNVRVVDANPTHVTFANGGIDLAAGEQVATRVLTLASGTNTVTVTVTDAAGNTTVITRTVVVDLDVPVVTILSPVHGAVFGAGQQVAPVTVQVDDISPTAISSVPAGVTASLPPGGGLAAGAVMLIEGLNTISVQANDPVNVSGSAAVMVRLDTMPPVVAITSPSLHATIRGVVDVGATAIDEGVGVAEVRFHLDGATSPFATVPHAPYEVQLDTRAIAAGSHVLTAVAVDQLGNAATTSATPFVVDNDAPVISLVSPVNGATVSGTADFVVRIEDTGSGSIAGQFTANGFLPAPLDPAFDAAPPAASRDLLVREDTTRHVDGPLVLQVRAVDAAGNTTESTFTFVVANSLPPACQLVPVSGSIIRGIVPVTATVTSGSYSDIEIRVDGVAVGISPASPFTIPLDTRARLDGAMRIEAVVRWGNEQQLVTASHVVVDNIAFALHPATLNLRGKSDQQETPVIAHLTGTNLGLLLPTEAHGIVLRVQNGGAVPAVAGWNGDDQIEEGKLRIRFERRAFAQAVQPALLGGNEAKPLVAVELWAEATPTAAGFLLGVTELRVIR